MQHCDTCIFNKHQIDLLHLQWCSSDVCGTAECSKAIRSCVVSVSSIMSASIQLLLRAKTCDVIIRTFFSFKTYTGKRKGNILLKCVYMKCMLLKCIYLKCMFPCDSFICGSRCSNISHLNVTSDTFCGACL